MSRASERSEGVRADRATAPVPALDLVKLASLKPQLAEEQRSAKKVGETTRGIISPATNSV